MVLSYCVKERKQTECVPNMERYEQSKNNRLMVKCICLSCGIVKTRFISQKGGVLVKRKRATGPYCGIGRMPKGHTRGTEIECKERKQLRYYGMEKCNPDITKKKTKQNKNKSYNQV